MATELNRREFLSSMTMAAGALTLGLGPTSSATDAIPGSLYQGNNSTGISNTAYLRAVDRAKALADQMTLDEMISQLGSQSSAIGRLNIPAYDYYTGEALHGLTQVTPATSFPVPLALAAAWNPDLVLRIYTAISDEARAYDNRQNIGLSYYSPSTLNLHRDPRWGRCEEAPGEDTCLVSTIAVQTVRGMQGNDPNYLKTTACSKHFICNNTDSDRTSISALVDLRSFWEYYTRAYRATVLQGDVFTVMGAYSALGGIPCCANHFLLTDLLRHQWGFRGYVTSDCDAIENIYDPHHYASTLPAAAALAVRAGCDLNCGGTLQAHLKEAVNQNLIGKEAIGLAVTRLLTVRFLLGLFDSPAQVSYAQIPFDVVNCPAHQELALEAARESIVLLKNDSQFLPLDKSVVKKMAVIGPMAGICYLGGYSGTPSLSISPYQGIAEKLGAFVYLPYIPASKMVASNGEVRLQPSSEEEFNVAFITDGTWAEFPKVDFTGKSEFQARVSSAWNGGLIEIHLDNLDGPLACTLTVPGTGDWQKWIDVTAPLKQISGEHSIFLRFRGQGVPGNGGYLLNIERLQLNPVSPPPVQPGRPAVVFKQGCSVTGEKDDKIFQEAVDAARDADVAVLVCGVSNEVNSEGRDRDTIGLTGAQPELIKAVFAVNPKTVLVLSTNNTVAVEWEQEHLLAIICAVCAGQAQGTAIADVLFGNCNPGGKLPCTWYRSVDQLPPFHDYDIKKGRTYLYFEGDPLYPFGHGLSYTAFRFDELQMANSVLGANETVDISLKVTNIGKREGTEIVQLYVTPPPSPVKRPNKQLVGFQRVQLQPGETKTVKFELPFCQHAFWYWDVNAGKFALQPGTARIQAGNSSANILLDAALTLKAAESTHGDELTSVAIASRVA